MTKIVLVFVIFASALVSCSRLGSAQEVALTPHHNGEAWGFVNERQEVVIRHKFEQAGHFVEGRARIKILGRWGFVNKDGILSVPAEYAEVTDFKDGVARVRKHTKWGAIDRNGNLLCGFDFDSPDTVDWSKKKKN